MLSTVTLTTESRSQYEGCSAWKQNSCWPWGAFDTVSVRPVVSAGTPGPLLVQVVLGSVTTSIVIGSAQASTRMSLTGTASFRSMSSGVLDTTQPEDLTSTM